MIEHASTLIKIYSEIKSNKLLEISKDLSDFRANFSKSLSEVDKGSEVKNIDKILDNSSDFLSRNNMCCESLSDINEKNRCCPRENGQWEGERGESKWLPDRNSIPGKFNEELNTWGEILDRYNIDGIVFKDGEPDFSSIMKGEVEISDFTTARYVNFSQADIKLAEQKGCSPEEGKAWRKENGYTWHECRDKITMQKVPNEVHGNIPHSGGISEAKKE